MILGSIILSLAAYGGLTVDHNYSSQSTSNSSATVAKQLSDFAVKQLNTDIDQHKLDGQPVIKHPRVFLSFLQNWQGQSVHPVFRERMALYKKRQVRSVNPCVYGSALAVAGCWVTKPKKETGDLLVKRLFQFYS